MLYAGTIRSDRSTIEAIYSQSGTTTIRAPVFYCPDAAPIVIAPIAELMLSDSRLEMILSRNAS